MAGRRFTRGQPSQVGQPGEEDRTYDPESDPMMVFFRNMMTHQNTMFQQMLQQAQPVPPTIVLPPPPTFVPGVKQFMEMKPTSFNGTEGPLAAEEWLKSTEKNLKLAKIPDTAWVELAQNQLTHSACHWWETELTRLTEPVAWKDFTESFNDKWFPEELRRQLQREFMDLKKGPNMSVDEYDHQFTKLSRYATALVAKESDRAHLFYEGLDTNTQKAICSSVFTTQAQVIVAAKKYERVMLKEKGVSSGKQYVETQRPTQRQNLGPQQNQQFKKPGISAQDRNKMYCHHCGKTGHIRKTCRALLGQCLICGSSTHQIKACPKSYRPIEAKPLNQQPAPAQRSAPVTNQSQMYRQAVQPKRQAYTMTAVENETVDDVITGN